MKSTTLNIRIEPDVKEQAEAVFKQLGISATTAVNLFFRQVIIQGGIPFELKIKQPMQTGQHGNLSRPLPQEAETGSLLTPVPDIARLTDEEILAVFRQIRKLTPTESHKTVESTPSTSLTDSLTEHSSAIKRIIPAFTTFDDDTSRADAWQKQHDNEGI